MLPHLTKVLGFRLEISTSWEEKLLHKLEHGTLQLGRQMKDWYDQNKTMLVGLFEDLNPLGVFNGNFCATDDLVYIHDLVFVHPELTGVVIVPPEWAKKWIRRDDDLDIAEEDDFRVFQAYKPIYFNSPHVRKKNCKKTPFDLRRKPGIESWDERGPFFMTSEQYWELLWSDQTPLELGKHLENDWRPVIPLSVLALTCSLFDGGVPNNLDDMEPVVLMMWS